jgi:hypothetical protein
VIDRFAASSESSIERYYARISGENSTFYDFIATMAPSSTLGMVTTLEAIQVDDSDKLTPLLPPDYYCNRDLQSETMGPVEFQDRNESMSIYQYLLKQPKSVRRKRSFVYGALWKVSDKQRHKDLNVHRFR